MNFCTSIYWNKRYLNNKVAQGLTFPLSFSIRNLVIQTLEKHLDCNWLLKQNKIIFLLCILVDLSATDGFLWRSLESSRISHIYNFISHKKTKAKLPVHHETHPVSTPILVVFQGRVVWCPNHDVLYIAPREIGAGGENGAKLKNDFLFYLVMRYIYTDRSKYHSLYETTGQVSDSVFWL